MLEIANPTLIGLIVAAGEVEFIPAVPWALEMALEELIRAAPSGSAIDRAVERWRLASGDTNRGFAGIGVALRGLAAAGYLVPEGRGWEAGYRVDPTWRIEFRTTLEALSGEEVNVLMRAAQRLVASRTILSKNCDASVVSSSETI